MKLGCRLTLPHDALFRRCAVQLGTGVVAAHPFRFVRFDNEWMSLHPGIVAAGGHLPRDLHSRLAFRNGKAVSFQLSRDVKVWPQRSNRGELVAKIFVDDAKRIGKLHPPLLLSVENPVAAVLVQNLGGFDGRVLKVLVGGIQRMIDAEGLEAVWKNKNNVMAKMADLQITGPVGGVRRERDSIRCVKTLC